MKRGWIGEVLEQTKEVESPPSFIYWAALSAISAITRKNVYWDKYIYKLYPNLYVMLIADSGFRKGFPIWLAKTLVEEVDNTRVIAGRNSIESIIAKGAQVGTLESGKQISEAHMFIVTDEFITLMTSNEQAFDILTTLYDTHAHGKGWKNTLKGSGEEKLVDPYITLLGASNPTNWNAAIPQNASTGGYVARCLMIVEKTKGKCNPLMEPPAIELNIPKLIPYLKEIAQLKGPFAKTKETVDCFKKWYEPHFAKASSDRTGTAERLHDQVLKVAMILSLSRRLTQVIELEDMEDAIDSCYSFAGNVKSLTEGQGKAKYGAQTKFFVAELIRAGASKKYTIKQKQFLRNNYGDFDHLILESVVALLEGIGWIKKGFDNGDETYTLAAHKIKEYETNKREEDES